MVILDTKLHFQGAVCSIPGKVAKQCQGMEIPRISKATHNVLVRTFLKFLAMSLGFSRENFDRRTFGFGPAIYCIYVDQPRSKVVASGLISSNPLTMTFQVIQKNLCKCFFWGTVHGFFCLVPVGSIPAK